MRARQPVAISRPVATAAQLAAVGEGQFPPVPGLEQGQIGLVVTVETIVVAAMLAVPHHDVGVLRGNNDVLVGVKPQRRRAFLVVTNIAVKIQPIRPSPNQIRVRLPGG